MSNIILLLILSAFSYAEDESSFFHFDINENSIYTPGSITLSLRLGEKSLLEGNYCCKVSFYFKEILLETETIFFNGSERLEKIVTFPGVDEKVTGRCRAELLLNGTALEARERFLTLYPFLSNRDINLENVITWVYDESERVQHKLKQLNIEYRDANFQPIRDYGTPDIIVIGEDVEPNSLKMLLANHAIYYANALLIYLNQKYTFCPQIKYIGRLQDYDKQSILCHYEDGVLDGINPIDIMELIPTSDFIKISTCHENIVSYIGRMNSDAYVESILVYLKDGIKQTIYCQIHLLKEGPIEDILLRNLIKFGIQKSKTTKQPIIERITQ